MIDRDRERELTPGCRDHVFLDSAGSSLPPAPVTGTVVGHLRREAEVGGYRAAAERAEDLAAVPRSLARLLGCAPDEIALTDSSTRAWDAVLTAHRWQRGDRVLMLGSEYASNAIALLQRARYDGCSVETVPSTPEGAPDLEAFAAMLDDRVRLVSVVHVPTNTGRIAPVRALTDLAHAASARVLLDACQSVGQLDVDVDALGVDALTASGRKWLRGPRGTGFLYLRRGVFDDLEPAAADLRGGTWTSAGHYRLRTDAARFELWEHDVAGRLGLGAAVDHLLGLGAAAVEQAVRANAAALRAALGNLRGVRVQDRGEDLSGIVTLTVDGHDADTVRARLLATGVTASVSTAGSTRLDMEARDLDAVVRLSPHYFNDAADLERAVAALADISAGISAGISADISADVTGP